VRYVAAGRRSRKRHRQWARGACGGTEPVLDRMVGVVAESPYPRRPEEEQVQPATVLMTATWAVKVEYANGVQHAVRALAVRVAAMQVVPECEFCDESCAV